MIRIRPSAPGDIASIRAIYAHAVTHGTASFELTPPEEAEMARRRAVLIETGFPYLVAETAGAVVGYAYAGPFRPRPAYRWTVEDSVYVAPDMHRAGVGRLLLRELISACEALGFRQMIAVIGGNAAEGSIRLHRALGFREAGRFPAIGFKHGEWQDSVLMQRALGDGDSTPPAGA